VLGARSGRMTKNNMNVKSPSMDNLGALFTNVDGFCQQFVQGVLVPSRP
jgi:hypothetical protein